VQVAFTHAPKSLVASVQTLRWLEKTTHNYIRDVTKFLGWLIVNYLIMFDEDGSLNSKTFDTKILLKFYYQLKKKNKKTGELTRFLAYRGQFRFCSTLNWYLDKPKVKAKGVKMTEEQKTKIQAYFRGLKKKNVRKVNWNKKYIRREKKNDFLRFIVTCNRMMEKKRFF
jgi:hypothetical protein